MTDRQQRRPGLRLWLDGTPLEGLGEWVLQLEVDERADEASTFRMTVDMSPISGDRAEGDWDVLERGTFADEAKVPDFHLLRRVTVQLGLAGDDPSKPEATETVFDGYVTAVEPVFGESRVPDSTLVLTGMDASCLMHLETVTRTWDGSTDAQIAQEIFEKYGFGADVEDAGLDRVQDRASLIQRSTDAEFLRMLARRNGFEVYVEPAGGAVSEGAHPGSTVVGHFHSSRVDGEQQPPVGLFPRDAPTLIEFRARYDGLQPTRILGWNIDEQTRKVQRVDMSEPGYGRMGTHSRADVMKERLAAIQPVRKGTTATGGPFEPVDLQSSDVPHTGTELSAMARSDYRMADWFVTGTATLQCERYPAVVRSRRPIELKGAGHLLDGRWYVQGVRHRWGVDPDAPDEEQAMRRYEADLTLVRNALGGPG